MPDTVLGSGDAAMEKWTKFSTHEDYILAEWRQMISKMYGMVSAREKCRTGKKNGDCWGRVAIVAGRVVSGVFTETLIFE